MTFSRPYRALVLPALAVLVPSAFTAVLAFQWLAVRREADELRGEGAATVALRELREDLKATLARSADQLLPRLRNDPHALPDGDSAWPAIVAEAFLFDANNRLSGRSSSIATTDSSSERAAALLESGVRALLAGRLAEADRAVSQLNACCAAVRDEFGVSYAIYAASQRLAIDDRKPNAKRPAAVVQDLRHAIEAGYFGHSRDVVSLRLLNEKLADVPGASELAELAEQKVASAARLDTNIHALETWVSSLDWTSVSRAAVLIGWIAPSQTAVAAWRPTPGQTVTLTIEPGALGDWVARQSAVRSSFVFALASRGDAPETAAPVLTSPLFAEMPALSVMLRRGPNDSATDRQREQLFMMAAGAVLLLTLVAGYFATRDVFRELRMASVRSTFLAGVTHEIKTPLTSIRLLAETLQQGRASPGESHELLSTIVNEAEHLSGLVDNVLGTSRIESGTRTYHPKAISVPDVVRATHQRFDYALTKAGFALVESIPTTGVWVHADPDALAQAVLNLLSNATKYSGDSREIRLTVAASAGEAVVSVADNGIGIPASEQARVFNSFYRARTTPSESTGTGLGLALVKHFAEAHGGRVGISSEPRRGSVFSIALPLIDPPKPGAQAHG